jgi:hypothetical protein
MNRGDSELCLPSYHRQRFAETVNWNLKRANFTSKKGQKVTCFAWLPRGFPQLSNLCCRLIDGCHALIHLPLAYSCDRTCQGVDKRTLFILSKVVRTRTSILDICQLSNRMASSSSWIVSSYDFARDCGCCSGFIALRNSEFECFQRLM